MRTEHEVADMRSRLVALVARFKAENNSKLDSVLDGTLAAIGVLSWITGDNALESLASGLESDLRKFDRARQASNN